MLTKLDWDRKKNCPRRELGAIAQYALRRFLVAVPTWSAYQILPELLHLCGCFLYLFGIFVALAW
jgi:hypothetical protein